MELVIQVDKPLDHLHPFVTKSGEQTQVLTVGSEISEGKGREDRGLLQSLRIEKRLSLEEMESKTIYKGQVAPWFV